jgi:hypothetical protein
MKITKRQLKRIIKEAVNPEARAIAIEVMEDTLNTLYHEEGFENDDLRAILLQLLKNLDSGFIGEPT